jgi:hypothetical protein
MKRAILSVRPAIAALLILVTLAVGILPRGVLSMSPDLVGQWGPVLDWGVQAKHMIVLPTGNVMVWSTGDNARVWDVNTDAPTKGYRSPLSSTPSPTPGPRAPR